VHGGGLTLNGWLTTLIQVARVVLPLAAALIIVDALRRPAADFGQPWRRWIWIAPQAVFVTFVIVGLIVPKSLILGGVIVLLIMVIVPLQLAYLALAIFTTRARRERA
jgi:hypothetical protein